MDTKKIEWILRISVAGEFIGHGIFATGLLAERKIMLFSSPVSIPQKAQWAGWIHQLTGIDTALAAQLLFFVGLFDLFVAFLILVKPIRLVLLWSAFWGFWTALVRPLVGEPFWDFVERFANWGAPLTLLMLRGWPRSLREWFR